jgi:pterin-4a-carbinolamine dehydratase
VTIHLTTHDTGGFSDLDLEPVRRFDALVS